MTRLTQGDRRRFAWAVMFAVMVAATAVVFDSPAEALVVIPFDPGTKEFIEWCRTHATSVQYILAGCWLYV